MITKMEQDILLAADDFTDEFLMDNEDNDEELIEYVRERVPQAPLSLILEVLGIEGYVADRILDAE